MAHISESYNDDRILAGLREIRPDIKLPTNVYIRGVEAEVGANNARPTIKVTLEFPLSRDEWRGVLDGARDER